MRFRFATISVVLLSLLSVSRATYPNRTEEIAELFESSFAHEVTGNLDRSLRDVLEILRVEPGHYIANYRAAWLYYLQARYTESVKYYEKASTIKPHALEPRIGMMLPLMAARRWAEAEVLGETILKQAPQNYLTGSRLAFTYFSQGKYSRALVLYKEVLAQYPSEIEMMLGIGWTYLKQGKTNQARAMFEQVLGIRRQNLNAKAGLEAIATYENEK